MSLRACACHGQRHREETLEAILPSERMLDIDPAPADGTGRILWICQLWLKERQRVKKRLEAGRKSKKGGVE